MSSEDFQTPQELEEWMHQQSIDPAEPSTLQYYYNNKDTSFPIKLDSDIRGRALVFVMTKERTPGWQKEVWAKYKMFKAIRVEAQFVYDPTASTIETTLVTFTTHDRTKNADMVFIAFCGHGCSKDGNMHDIHLITDDLDFNIWPGCQFILGKRSCQIKEKPKVFLVQACRDPDQRSANANRNNGTEQDMNFMRKPESLQEYMFVCASQPGEVAYRPYFSESVSELVIQNSGKFKLQDILTTQLNRLLKSICNQRSHFSTSMTYDLNIFLLDTRESDLQYPVQESSTLSDSVHSQGMKSNPNIGNPSCNTSPDKSIVTGADQVPQLSNPASGHGISPSGIDRKTDKDSQSRYKVTKQQGERQNKARHEVKIEILHTGPSDSQEKKEKAQNIMLDEVSKSENKRRLEENLSDDLEAKVNIIDVYKGSVIIQITLEEEEALNSLVFMSDTGLLSYKMQSYLVTQEYLDRCKVERVKIKATVNSQKMPPLLEELLLECIVENENVSVKCPFEAVNEGTWFKDGCRLEMTERHTICLDDDKPKMKIVKTTIKDRGRYKCEYTGLDNRKHIMECSVLVYPKTDPPKNVNVIDIKTTSAVVTWSAPDNNLPCTYNVYYWPELGVKHVLNVESCRIENLTPGETYHVSVTSIPHKKTEYTESYPEPPNGFRFDTKPSNPTNVQVNKDGQRAEIHWQPGPGNNSGFIVRYIESREDGKYIFEIFPNINTSLTLDDLKPDTKYTFTVISLWHGKLSDESEAVTIKTDR